MADVEADPDRTVIERVDPRLGMVFGGRYRVVQKLAAGGFGAVYMAIELDSDREVAIKMLHPELAADPLVAARFRREASALALLTDKHTVTALDAGEADDGTLYIVMELLEGESLYERYRAVGKLPWQDVLAIARGVCSSVAEAHELGIIHRDLKPANIHLEHRDGVRDFVKVLDFGIAKAVPGSEMGTGGDLTQVGQMIGTCDYMPPEQMIGTCTPESDVFTIGVVMYEMISGRKPFGDSKGPAAQLAAVLGTTPDPLTNVPLTLACMIAKCLAREPERRYRNAAELGSELSRMSGVDDGDATKFVAPRRATTIPGATPKPERTPTPQQRPSFRNARPTPSEAALPRELSPPPLHLTLETVVPVLDQVLASLEQPTRPSLPGLPPAHTPTPVPRSPNTPRSINPPQRSALLRGPAEPDLSMRAANEATWPVLRHGEAMTRPSAPNVTLHGVLPPILPPRDSATFSRSADGLADGLPRARFASGTNPIVDNPPGSATGTSLVVPSARIPLVWIVLLIALATAVAVVALR